MLERLARTAHELDEWLHQNVGRGYVALLTWGLVVSVLNSVAKLWHALSSFGFITLVLQGALLVNLLAQWHELRERRRRKKAGAVAGPGAAAGAPFGAERGVGGGITHKPF